jgi:peptide deformylase
MFLISPPPTCYFASTDVLTTLADLQDTLIDLQRIHGRGGGLAAPQIGSTLNIVYINAKGRSFHLSNPVIVERSEETFEVWDFCFSANAAFLAPVTRNLRIVVEYRDSIFPSCCSMKSTI